ncbi:hypothetical protein B484DRAFT_227097 [Ochromonadaceae sp. CCMP2298]|nr:hypothetical protein B484DRAFT_227097 [Ochromonadaceae sp. CCMP2298]
MIKLIALLLVLLICNVGASTGFNPRTPVSWSNRLGVTLTPITTGVWAAERPFMWNGIDVGGRSVVARMEDGSLMVHSPVEWTEELGKAPLTLHTYCCRYRLASYKSVL